MPRSSTVLNEETNQAAVQFIEQGLSERRTVKEILEAMRRQPQFAGLAASRITKQWNTVWRPRVAANGRVPLPTKGGRGRMKPTRRQERMAAAPPAALRTVPAPAPSHLTALDEMVDAVSAMLADAPDTPARDEALRVFPRFIQAVRSLSKSL